MSKLFSTSGGCALRLSQTQLDSCYLISLVGLPAGRGLPLYRGLRRHTVWIFSKLWSINPCISFIIAINDWPSTGANDFQIVSSFLDPGLPGRQKENRGRQPTVTMCFCILRQFWERTGDGLIELAYKSSERRLGRVTFNRKKQSECNVWDWYII